MDILIIATYFPPDTAIAAVRPYMFAKYLRKQGHNVTVLRSGEISKSVDNSLPYSDLGIRVCSFLGENSAAECIARGESVQTQFAPVKSRLKRLPYFLRKPASKVYRSLKRPVTYYREMKNMGRRIELQKQYIEKLKEQHFDVVFATYGELENVYAGKYAAEQLGCKWVLDFRDAIAQKNSQSAWEYFCLRKREKEAINFADMCTAVSDDLAKQLAAGTNKKVYTVYNGYDRSTEIACQIEQDDVLRFAYTGVMYGDRSAESLFSAIRKLSDARKVDLNKVCFEYAGSNFEIIQNQAQRYGVEEILINHGIVGRAEAARIQNMSDIFLVLSWNTKKEQGVLTGKFYEGIRAGKPILALLKGNEPNSELLHLNEKYHYGFCYEECSDNENFEHLCQWIERLYNQKQNEQPVKSEATEAFASDFLYENLTQRLEQLLSELTGAQNE